MAERERELLRTIELLSEYGRAKLGGDWWPRECRAIPAIRSRRGPRRRKPGKLHAPISL